MIKDNCSILKSLAVAAASFAMVSSAEAAFVYENPTPQNSPPPEIYLHRGTGNSILEFGDQIFLGGSERLMTDFSVEYFLGLNASGNETARLMMYRNDGASGAPMTVFYDSGTTPIDPGTSGYRNLFASGLGIEVPTTFTWTILFGGVEAGETAGLVLHDPPSVGSSLVDFWAKSADGSWSTILIDGGATPGTFAARVSAVVPEPGTYALIVGGLSALGFAQYRRRKQQ